MAAPFTPFDIGRVVKKYDVLSMNRSGTTPSHRLAPPSYFSVVRNTYPTAVLAETFGTKTLDFIQSTFEYSSNDVLVAESICSDDIDAPVFNLNIGQFPDSMTQALNPFLAGGIGGFPHTGVTGLAAWISHVPATGALFLYSAPHIGITIDGSVGFVRRRGQNGRLSGTCGAVNAAIGSVVDQGWTPSLSAVTPLAGAFGPISVYYDYQQFTLTNILYNNKNTLIATPASDRMRVATEMIRVASKEWINNNLSTSYTAVTASVGTPDVYFATGTFINTDDGYDAYMQVSSFEKYNPITRDWTDYTSSYLAAITP